MENNRIRFVVPEAARCFPRTAPLASMLLSSKRALAEVKRICQGRNSVLVCDVVGEAEVSLSSVRQAKKCKSDILALLNGRCYVDTINSYTRHNAGSIFPLFEHQSTSTAVSAGCWDTSCSGIGIACERRVRAMSASNKGHLNVL